MKEVIRNQLEVVKENAIRNINDIITTREISNGSKLSLLSASMVSVFYELFALTEKTIDDIEKDAPPRAYDVATYPAPTGAPFLAYFPVVDMLHSEGKWLVIAWNKAFPEYYAPNGDYPDTPFTHWMELPGKPTN